MNNTALYDRFTDVLNFHITNDLLDAPSLPKKEIILSEQYKDLLPLYEIDSCFEDLIVSKMNNIRFDHFKYICKNLYKTSHHLKISLMQTLHFMYVIDSTEEEKMDYLLNHYKRVVERKSMYLSFKYVKTNFTKDNQDKILAICPENATVIANPTDEVIMSVLESGVQLGVYIKDYGFKLSDELELKIIKAMPMWLKSVENWTQEKIKELVDHIVNPPNSNNMNLAFIQWKMGKLETHHFYNYFPWILAKTILKENNISTLDLYRLSINSICKKHIIKAIKAHPNYKNTAEIILNSIYCP